MAYILRNSDGDWVEFGVFSLPKYIELAEQYGWDSSEFWNDEGVPVDSVADYTGRAFADALEMALMSIPECEFDTLVYKQGGSIESAFDLIDFLRRGAFEII